MLVWYVASTVCSVADCAVTAIRCPAAQIYVCPPVACLATCSRLNCAGHEFTSKGVTGCVDTGADPGNIFNVIFLVCDK